jgi:membrane protein YdbS with pleckstrin-like domain
MADKSRSGYTFTVTADAINISTQLKKHWLQLMPAILSMLVLIAAIIYWAMKVIEFSAGMTPGTILVLVLTALLVIGLYLLSKQAVENACRQEDVKITGTSITIEKFGFLMFRSKRVIPASRIIGIGPTIQLYAQGSKLVDFFMNTSRIGKLSITTRQWLTTDRLVCRGISVDEMVNALDRIHEKYPQYW